MNSKEALSKIKELLEIGNIAKESENYIEAIAAYKTAYELCKFLEPEQKKIVSTIHTQIGNVYLSINQYLDALDEFEKSLSINLQFYKDTPHPAIVTDYNNLAVVYQQIDEIEKAEECIHKAYEVLSSMQPEEIENFEDIETIFNSLGLVHHRKKEFNTAIEFYKKSIYFMLRKGGAKNNRHLATTYCNIGMAYFESGNTDEALNYLHMSEKIFKDLKSSEVFYIYSCLMDVYEAKGDKDKVNYYKSLINKSVNFVLN